MNHTDLPIKSTRVLIVDDDKFICALFQNALNNAGFETVTAPEGASGIKFFAAFQPDIVLLDMNMPIKDGCQACREIRSMPEGRYVPILMITSMNDTGLIHRAFQAGATDFVTKPVNAELLVYRVLYMLRASRSMRSIAESEARLANAQCIAHMGNWEWNCSTGLFQGSEELFRILGMKQIPPDFTYKDFLASVCRSDREKVRVALHSLCNHGTSCELEFTIQRQGSPGCVTRLQGQVQAPYSAKSRQIVGTLQDITEMKQAENHLRMLKKAVDCLPIGITLSDAHGRIVYCNPAEAKIHGYTVNELMGREARQFAKQKQGKDVSSQHLNNSGSWRRDSVNVRKNGDEFPVQLTSIPVNSSDGVFLGMVTACEDISARKEAELKIHHLAYYDTLTGLPNRRLFLDRLQQALALSSREGGKVGMLFLDLDNFKDVNDTQGHPCGDKLLQEVAERLAANKRDYEVLARFGGDEFVVLLAPINSAEDIASVAQRLLATFSHPFSVGSREVYCGASVGIAQYPDDGRDVESLLRCADTAMYHAKNEGKSCYRFFTADMNEKILYRVTLENGLRQAVAKQELFLVFQPQWELESKQVAGVEALVRWKNPDYGLLPPSEFIPLAEEIGLIGELGEWVLRSVCLQAKAWLASGIRDLRIAVNISGKQLEQPDFLHIVEKIIRETGADPKFLDFEFTESSIMGRTQKIIEIFRSLKKMGFCLSIDDFGTGYSSLSYLKHFPIDRIKIDRSFVEDVNHSNDDAAIVKAIISMARALKLKVVAEGVENSAQLHFLTDHGCDEVQGFFLATPMSAEELPEHLKIAMPMDNILPLCGRRLPKELPHLDADTLFPYTECVADAG